MVGGKIPVPDIARLFAFVHVRLSEEFALRRVGMGAEACPALDLHAGPREPVFIYLSVQEISKV